MTLSIIIVNYNYGADLNECVNSISGNPEIIVVDNNSSDDSLQKLENKKIKIIKNRKNLGFAKAANQGIKIAKGKNILLLNGDVILNKDSVSKTLNFLEKTKDANIVGCRLVNPDGSVQNSCRRFPTFWNLLNRKTHLRKIFPKTVEHYLMKDYDRKEARKVDWVSGAFLLMKNKNLLDEKFFLYFEDTDLCKRVGNVYYFPNATAVHKKEKGSSGNLRLSLHHLKSALYYFWKHL